MVKESRDQSSKPHIFISPKFEETVIAVSSFTTAGKVCTADYFLSGSKWDNVYTEEWEFNAMKVVRMA